MAKKGTPVSDSGTTDENVETESAFVESVESVEEAEKNPSENNEHAELTLLLEDARAKADEHWNQVLLSNAELENTRRRARQDVENAHKFALEKFALELLPVKDSMEMGLAITSADSEEDSEKTAQLREGIELTLKMLTAAMEKFGITTMGEVGEGFNPDIHQAMSLQESADHAPNTVMAVMQKGYLLNNRLIRPAMVVVSKATEVAKEQ